jgi:hypothetical protein
MRNSHAIVLRKVGGVFGALWQGSTALLPIGGVSNGGATGAGMLGALGAFCAVLLAPLMVLAVIALVLLVVPAAPAHVAAKVSPFAGLALAGTTDEVKKLLTDLGKTVDEFKASNNERLAEIEKKGVADPLLVAKVDKANAAITSIEEKLEEQKKSLRDVETAQARVSSAGNMSDSAKAERDNVRKFLAMVHNKPLRKVTVTDDDVTALSRVQGRHSRSISERVSKRSANLDVRNALSTGTAPDRRLLGHTGLLSGKIIEKVLRGPRRACGRSPACRPIGTDTFEGPNTISTRRARLRLGR